ncbi:MAG: DUF4157 domain-containing protein [Coleofasciculus sp. C1-SOL-03]|uniref:eCIS core domain-containing protein n=1 Tax=Coleofasciculus sp. C1-SOL-03 TaxID=3069522 RepID=UPI0032F323C3
MYKPPQKKNSSWTPSTVQKKGKSPSKLGHFSIQPKSNPSSASSQEIGEYSRDSADRLTANVMRGLQAKEQEQAEGLTLSEAEGSTLQPKFESPWAPTFDPPPPLPQSPASQLKGAFAPVSENPIQRQCADCAKEEEEQAPEAGKDLEEIGIQTKLTVGAPGDPYEQEADLVETLHATSLQVMSMSAPPDSSASVQRQLDTNHPHHPHQIWQRAQSITPVVQRQIDPRVQMRQMIQRAAQIDGNQASFDLESRLNSSKGGGSPLSEDVRGFMEPRFGADFSGVRVHTGSEAVQMNKELGAQAFTHGSDIYFGAGKLPGNNELTAHELTHVMQQGGEQIALKIKEVVQFKQFTNEKEINPRVELSNNKGGGTEKECTDILRRIRNLIQEVRKRIGELAENVHNLPETHPDDDKKPRLSKRGHRRLINEAKESLAAQKAKYVAKCGQLPEDVRESDDPNVNWFRLPDWAVRAGVIIVAGAIVIGATVTLPSWGLAALITLAGLLGLQLIDRRPIY